MASKQQHAKARTVEIQDETTTGCDSAETEGYLTTPSSSKKLKEPKAKASKKIKHVQKKNTMGSQSLATGKQSAPRKLALSSATQAQNNLDILELAATILLTIDDVEGIDTWLKENGFENNESIQKLAESSRILSKALQPRIAAKQSVGSEKPLELLDQFFLFRKSNQSMILLAPVEAPFRANMLKGKVFGFVRRKGAYYPLMCALPGKTQQPYQPHPLLLDCDIWNAEVKRLADRHGYAFHTNGWDARFGPERQGEAYASHVEPKLMLFYACRLLCKLTGGKVVKKQVLKLYKIHELAPKHVAEILLTRPSCTCCKKFQQEFKGMTGLLFTFSVIPTLGEMMETKDGEKVHGYLHPTMQVDSEDEDAPLSRNLRVIIPNKPASTARRVSPPTPTTSNEAEKLKSIPKTVAKRGRPKKATNTEHKSEASTKISRKRMLQIYEEDYDDYQPPYKRSADLNQVNITRASVRSGLLTPEQTPSRKKQMHDGWTALLEKFIRQS